MGSLVTCSDVIQCHVEACEIFIGPCLILEIAQEFDRLSLGQIS